MSIKRLAWIPLLAAWVASVVYIFVFGIDWEFTLRSDTVPSAVVTGLIVSIWASVPYLVLLPMAGRDGGPLFTVLAVIIILTFGWFSMDLGRHTPGNEGGSYIVVPLQQIAVAIVILLGWKGIRRMAR
jgi:hypothetical protein